MTPQQPAYNPTIMTPDASAYTPKEGGGDNFEDEPPLMEGMNILEEKTHEVHMVIYAL